MNNKKLYKVYNDGGHFVASLSSDYFYSKKRTGTRSEPTEQQKYFDEKYTQLLMQGIKPNKLFLPLKDAMLEKYPNIEDVNDFITKNIKRQRHNYFSRIKRLKRKAYMNIWTHWLTITYDSNKHDETSFKRKVKKCLSNLHSRRGWNFMYAFERGAETERLHLHAVVYIPQGEMIGEIVELKDYSIEQHKMQITHSNTFFAERFGRNDFVEITQEDIKQGKILEYLTKYMTKNNEKIIYSRGIPTEVYCSIADEDIASEMTDYVPKFVLFDDLINIFRDIFKVFKMKHKKETRYILPISPPRLKAV